MDDVTEKRHVFASYHERKLSYSLNVEKIQRTGPLSQRLEGVISILFIFSFDIICQSTGDEAKRRIDGL